MEIVQLVMPAGANLPTYEAHGEIILHCLEGRVALTALGETYDVAPGNYCTCWSRNRFPCGESKTPRCW